MYLARLILNPRCKEVWRDVKNVSEMHRTVMSAFPQRPAAEKQEGRPSGVLWRFDLDRRRNRLVLYVQSADAPDWSKLVAKFPEYLVPVPELAARVARPVPSENPAVRDDFPPPFSKSQRLSFRLRANPVVRKKEFGKDRQRASGKSPVRTGKRIGLYDENEQREWLKRKADTAGFRVLQATVIPEESREERSSDRHYRFASVLFEGILEVTDPDAFVKTMQAGIGPGKAFGFGLLSVAPV